MAKKSSPWAARAGAVRQAETDNFVELIKLSGLDPGRDLTFKDWSGVDFSGCNLDGFNFSHSYLHGSVFKGARIFGARLDQAELGRIVHRPGRDPHLPAETTAIANLRETVDWSQYASPENWQPRSRRHSNDSRCIGAIFHDAPFTPEMVVVPPGTFMMGSPPGEGDKNEHPQREVTIGYRIAVGRFPVTVEEWSACAVDGGTSYRPSYVRWGRRQPVINVSWGDVNRHYLPWLNHKLGLSAQTGYRLLTEAEWEYCCRAGTTTVFNFGDTITKVLAQFAQVRPGGKNTTVDVGTFPANAFGLYDMHGNVWEWCQDSYTETYARAPQDGSAVIDVGKHGFRVLRGGGFDKRPGSLRVAFRLRRRPDDRGGYGFRVARTLIP